MLLADILSRFRHIYAIIVFSTPLIFQFIHLYLCLCMQLNRWYQYTSPIVARYVKKQNVGKYRFRKVERNDGIKCLCLCLWENVPCPSIQGNPSIFLVLIKSCTTYVAAHIYINIDGSGLIHATQFALSFFSQSSWIVHSYSFEKFNKKPFSHASLFKFGTCF